MTDKTREAFEASCAGRYNLEKANDIYIDLSTRESWYGYQAATAAAEAKYLPVLERLVEALEQSKSMHARASALYVLSSCGNAGYNEDNNRAIKGAFEALALAAPLLEGK